MAKMTASKLVVAKIICDLKRRMERGHFKTRFGLVGADGQSHEMYVQVLPAS